ncbi:MAG: hypothetical protein ISN29_00025 [Gammaproteobacteria bacterium AqS3]|nr:hypothetical protein [Gammaproteobacteria bacterium AqS3]
MSHYWLVEWQDSIGEWHSTKRYDTGQEMVSGYMTKTEAKLAACNIKAGYYGGFPLRVSKQLNHRGIYFPPYPIP